MIFEKRGKNKEIKIFYSKMLMRHIFFVSKMLMTHN